MPTNGSKIHHAFSSLHPQKPCSKLSLPSPTTMEQLRPKRLSNLLNNYDQQPKRLNDFLLQYALGDFMLQNAQG